MSSALHVVQAGDGPRALLIHGSAADHTTWSIQLARLRDRFELVAYDRRPGPWSVEDHAADARALLGEAPALVIGSSFGAVVALELLRGGGPAGAILGAVLIEPPLGASDDAPAAPAAFLAEYDRLVADEGGPAAAAFFMRTVLGADAVARIPQVFLDRTLAKWQQIRDDSAALIAYRPRYRELAAIATPVLLVGGGRSAPYFRPTLEALRAALPGARLEAIPGAGHMLHAEAHRQFGELVVGFAAELGLARG